MYPQLNRIISFHPTEGNPVPALVCGIDPSKTDGVHLHLTVFDPVQGPYLKRGVQGKNEGSGAGQWAWPSYTAGGSADALLFGKQAEQKAPPNAFREDRDAQVGRSLNLREIGARAVGAFGNVGGRPFRSHGEEIDAAVQDARERGKQEAATLDEQVRRDIAGDPIGYGDERSSGNPDTPGDRPEEVVEDRPVQPSTHGSAVPLSSPGDPQAPAQRTS